MVPRKSDRSTKAATPERAPQITPMPFPGESPTVSLAMAAGRMYGLQPEEEKAAARPRRRAKAASRKATSKPARSGTKPKARAKRATRPKSR
jgi:hypothetical protein